MKNQPILILCAAIVAVLSVGAFLTGVTLLDQVPRVPEKCPECHLKLRDQIATANLHGYALIPDAVNARLAILYVSVVAFLAAGASTAVCAALWDASSKDAGGPGRSP